MTETEKQTVFERVALSRADSKWENHLGTLTPWENRGGIWFKRDDYFAPLGYGGPNGSKMRQLIWYVNRYRSGRSHIVTGASVQSPQLSMSAIVGRHYGLPARQVVYSKPHTVLRHENTRIAYGFGAEFEYATGPYNPIIQRRVADLTHDDSLVVEYGITVPHDKYDPEEVRKFHEVGAHQVSNMPDRVSRLIVPAGSCNSLCSILLGLTRDSKNLSELIVLGIGPDKRRWVRERMALVGVDVSGARLPFAVEYHSLHDTGYSRYSDHFKGESFEGIHFHPTYEAKMWRWLNQRNVLGNMLPQNDSTAFWIVGSAPNPAVVEPFYTRRTENANT
jgi:1-aminocyclopropane-1-carboxylate deaminase/D-cysteine desulfhydrase-like pyridoxal-dependent ACC family enzyme